MDQAPAQEIVVEKTKQCEGADCDKDAGTLQCPTCQKIGKESFFCSQDCFKRNWVGQCSLQYNSTTAAQHADSTCLAQPLDFIQPR